MSTRLFYCPDLQPGQTELAGTDAHHLLHVLRLEPGQQVQLFDGQGRLANAQISQLGRKTVVLTIASITQPPDHRIQLVLATALPKYSRQQWLVEKCTELGVDKLIPQQFIQFEFGGNLRQEKSFGLFARLDGPAGPPLEGYVTEAFARHALPALQGY